MQKSHSTSLNPRIVSLYSGAGGMDIGFAQAGFDIAFANDIDPFAIATHKKTHLSQDPEWAEAAKNLAHCESVVGDVRDFNWGPALPGIFCSRTYGSGRPSL